MGAARTRPQCTYSLVSVACTRSSARCQSSHSTAASRRSDESLAVTYSVYSASRPRLTADRHRSSRAPHLLEARGAAFGCHARQDLSFPLPDARAVVNAHADQPALRGPNTIDKIEALAPYAAGRTTGLKLDHA
jgi:hypothetical protein